MSEFWAWYRHARSFGKPVTASLIYARAKSQKEAAAQLGTGRRPSNEVESHARTTEV